MGLETCKGEDKMAQLKNEQFWVALYALICQTIDVCCSMLLEWRSRASRIKKLYQCAPDFSVQKMVKNIFGVELVDVFHIPLHRRLETLAVLQWTFTFLYFGLTCLTICVLMLFTPLFFVPLCYLAWYVYDYRTPERGGRRWEWVRSWRLWSFVRDYFPISMHRTSEIDPSKNYMFIYHPHGIMSFGAFSCFATNGSPFASLFPGLRPTLLTLKYQFAFPLQREYSMAFGACACSRESIEWLLTREGTGNAVVLVVGGANEALEARPDSYSLTIKQRKGFVRLAMQHGTPLVPVYGFGENNLFNQVSNPPGSLLRRFQTYMTKVCTFSPPLFHGRGIFNYTFGFMPFRRPVNVVVGSPMNVERVENPTDEEVDAVHKSYIDQLNQLFETHKATYGISPDKHLSFI